MLQKNKKEGEKVYTISRILTVYFVVAMVALFFFLLFVIFPAMKRTHERIKMHKTIKRLNKDWEAKNCGKNKQR